MAQDKDDLFARSKFLQDIFDIDKFLNIIQGCFTPRLLALFVNVELIGIDFTILDLAIVIASAKANRILFKVRRHAPGLDGTIANKADTRTFGLFIVRDKILALAVAYMLHHSIGHRIARFKAMRTRPEIAHMLFEVRHIAKLPAFHVLADFCKATFSIENQQLICKFCLRSVIAPVAIAANIFCNIVCLRKEIAIRRIALHHHRNRKERGTVVARTKQANIFCRGVRGCCRLTTPPRESLTKACSARRSAKAYAERRKHVAQCTPALASNRLVIARIFDKLHHTRGSHVCQNIHVKRIALGQVHNCIELYKRCRKTRRKFVHIITICFDSHIRRNKVDTVKIKGSIRSDDAGFVSPLGIGKPLQAIKFHNLHRYG